MKKLLRYTLLVLTVSTLVLMGGMAVYATQGPFLLYWPTV